MKKNKHEAYDFISVKAHTPIDAIVYRVISEVEAIYNQKPKHIIEEFILKYNQWVFKSNGASGGYANNNPMCQPFITALKEKEK